MIKDIRTDPVTVGSTDTRLIGMRPWLIEGNLIGAKRNAEVAAIIRDCKKDVGETSTRSQDAVTPVLITEKVLGPPDFFESFDPSRLGFDIPYPLCMRKGEKTVDPAGKYRVLAEVSISAAPATYFHCLGMLSFFHVAGSSLLYPIWKPSNHS